MMLIKAKMQRCLLTVINSMLCCQLDILLAQLAQQQDREVPAGIHDEPALASAPIQPA